MTMQALNETDYEKKFIDAGGIRTCYIEAGSGEPLILIHGGGAGANGYGNWYSCLPLFARHFRTIAIDMLGFGQTDSPDPASFEYTHHTRISHVAAFIRAMGLNRASLVGNSMGGATSLGVAVEHPQLVGKLVLMGAAAIRTPMSEALQPVVGYDYTREGMRRLIDLLTNDDFEITQQMIDYRYAASIDPKNKASYTATMAWVRQQGGLYYAEDFIARVSQNTLVVNGKNDLIIPMSSAYRLLELIEHSWGYILPHCGHWAMIEHPEDFSTTVTNFVLNH
nr:G494 [uncultured bacterium]